MIQINTEDVQIMIEASNEKEIEEWYRQGYANQYKRFSVYSSDFICYPTRQLKELKNAITIKALKVSADEVQDVIASRLIPMIQERENLIDSGKSAAANVH